MILSATFVAVPALSLVDPVKISGPTARWIARSTITVEAAVSAAVSPSAVDTPATDVKHGPAFPERPRHDLDRLGKIDNRAAQRILHKSLFLDKKLHQLTRAHFFQIFRARVALLG